MPVGVANCLSGHIRHHLGHFSPPRSSLWSRFSSVLISRPPTHFHLDDVMASSSTAPPATIDTRIVKIDVSQPLGSFSTAPSSSSNNPGNLTFWTVHPDAPPALAEAAALLRTSAVPVAFPTETVYGLGADATRSEAVRGIYAAKGRPADNPLIVHVCDLDMLRGILRGREHNDNDNDNDNDDDDDPIPKIYRPLLERFWPGPLTIILPLPTPSPLAAEVTASLPTFGARMPASPLALTLISLAGAPVAAPSANASTRPSPTTAQHVRDDLVGRIELVLDGGACAVGVESTVVDGLCEPPAVLRPGGVGIGEIRACEGWEGVVKGYRDRSELGDGAVERPRAPGMKYKHYSPRARVVLYEEGGVGGRERGEVERDVRSGMRVGLIRTMKWAPALGFGQQEDTMTTTEVGETEGAELCFSIRKTTLRDEDNNGVLMDADLGRDSRAIAHGLFAALRELDRRGAEVIYVEGIEDESDVGGAVMNRLRKAASDIR